MRAIYAFYEAIAAFVFANLTAILIAIGVAVLISAAYKYGRHTQHEADLKALGESYRNGWDDRTLTGDGTAMVGGEWQPVGLLGGRDLGGPGDWPTTLYAPTSWRDVPAELKAADAVRDWRAERGLVVD